MASSDKKKSSKGTGAGSSMGKGQNSRTGGSATPRAPKPKAEPPAEPKGRGRTKSTSGRSTDSKKNPRTGSSPRSGSASKPAASKGSSGASKSSFGKTKRDPELQPRARARKGAADRPPDGSGNGSSNGSRRSGGARVAPEPDDRIELDEHEVPVDDRFGSDDRYEDDDGHDGYDGYDVEDDVEDDGYDDEDGDTTPPVGFVDRMKLLVMGSPPEERDRTPARTREEPVDEWLPDGTRVPRWGLGDVLLAFFAALFLPILGLLLFLALGYVPTAHATGLGGDGAALGEAIGHVDLNQPPTIIRSFEYAPYLLQFFSVRILFWVGLMGPTAWAVWKKGNGFVKDLKLRFTWLDVPLGLGVGVACQLLLVPGIYWIVEKIAPGQDVGAVAQQVVDDAVDPISTVLVIIGTTIGAPIVEEIYYRGLTLRAAEKRFGPTWALVGTSAFFAITHFAPIVWPGILVFGVILGVLAQRTNRLGAPIFAHIGFNLTTLVVLLLHIDLPTP